MDASILTLDFGRTFTLQKTLRFSYENRGFLKPLFSLWDFFRIEK